MHNTNSRKSAINDASRKLKQIELEINARPDEVLARLELLSRLGGAVLRRQQYQFALNLSSYDQSLSLRGSLIPTAAGTLINARVCGEHSFLYWFFLGLFALLIFSALFILVPSSSHSYWMQLPIGIVFPLVLALLLYSSKKNKERLLNILEHCREEIPEDFQQALKADSELMKAIGISASDLDSLSRKTETGNTGSEKTEARKTEAKKIESRCEILQRRLQAEKNCRFQNKDLEARFAKRNGLIRFIYFSSVSILAMAASMLLPTGHQAVFTVIAACSVVLLLIGFQMQASNKALFSRAAELILRSEPASGFVHSFYGAHGSIHLKFEYGSLDQPISGRGRLLNEDALKQLPQLMSGMAAELYLDPESKKLVGVFHENRVVWFI